MKQTKVVFRTFEKDGSIVALFPYNIQNNYGDCLSFKISKEHAPINEPIDYLGAISKSVRSTPEEVTTIRLAMSLNEYKNIVEVKRINVKEVEKAHKEFRLKG